MDAEESMYEPSSRGSLEDCLRSLGSETASSKTSSSDSEDHSRAATHWHGFFRMLKKGPQKLTRKKSKRIREDMVPPLNSSIDSEFCCFKSSWKNFTLSELQAASNDFSHGQWLFIHNLIYTFGKYKIPF